MIQRAQSIYYLIAIVSLIFITTGATIFSYNSINQSDIGFYFKVNSYGIQVSGEIDEINFEQITNDSFRAYFNEERHITKTSYHKFPFYIFSILLTFILTITLLRYKKQDTQLRLGRLSFFIALVGFLFIIISFYLVKSSLEEFTGLTLINTLGLGFFLFVFVVAFTFLGNLGVRKDIKILKSIDRIR